MKRRARSKDSKKDNSEFKAEEKKKKGISGFPKTATTNAHGSGFNEQAFGRYVNS